jgi:hypothetical protein
VLRLQDRYAGDIGDYGKLGLLRALRSAGLSIGVNWYLTPNEKHNEDGKHTEYLEKGLYFDCDEALWNELHEIVETDKRNVSSLQDAGILDASYYSSDLDFTGKTRSERNAFRDAWHKDALTALAGVDVVFVDPDNGLLVPSAEGSRKENKFVKSEELWDNFFENHSSVVYYQHKARRTDPFYIDQYRKLLESFELNPAVGFGLKFVTTSLRYYFFIIQPQHRDIIKRTVGDMLAGPWRDHFLYYDPTQTDVFVRND